MRLNIEHLHLQFANAAGHEHRARPVARRALELLHLRLRDELLASGIPLDRLRLGTLAVPAIHVDLRVMSDEAAAEKIAGALYAALYARWHED